MANAGSPVFEELRALALKTFGLTDVLRTALAPVSQSIRAAFVYGSIAKGQDTAASDIDLMVKNRWDNRSLTVTFSYRFGKSSVAQARRRNTGVNEEQNRAAGGQQQ